MSPTVRDETKTQVAAREGRYGTQHREKSRATCQGEGSHRGLGWEHAELAMRTVANWKGNWLRERAWSGSRGRTEKWHIRRKASDEGEGGKSVATRRKKHGRFQTGVPLTVGTIN